MVKPEVIALKFMMKKQSINQSELARRAECSTTYISRILGGSAPFGQVAQERIFTALGVTKDEASRILEGVKNESSVSELSVPAPEFTTLAREEIGLQMIPINEKDVRLVLSVSMPFVDAFRVYKAIEESMAE